MATAFANIYDEICQNNNEYTDVAEALKWSAILSVLGYGVVDDKVDIFNDYSDTLDRDNSLITYMQSKTSSKTGMPKAGWMPCRGLPLWIPPVPGIFSEEAPYTSFCPTEKLRKN